MSYGSSPAPAHPRTRAAPSPHHYRNAHLDQWDDRREQRGAEVVARHRGDERVAAQLGREGLDGKPIPFLADVVDGELCLQPGDEPPDVLEEVGELVAPVEHQGREFLGFRVVVLAVVVEIRVPRVAHQRYEDNGYGFTSSDCAA